MNQFYKNFQEQTLFYRTLSTTAVGPKSGEMVLAL